MAVLLFFVVALFSVAIAQRPGYAGSLPYGYPVIVTTTTTTTAPPPGATDSLGNRFGDVPTTTARLPPEANGNSELINQLMMLPVDQRPFWLINFQALDEYRNRPQTFPIKDNDFADPYGDLMNRNGWDHYASMYLNKKKGGN